MKIQGLKFPKERLYPIAFATFLMYLAWHPLGDFIESLIIGWSIVPCEIFTGNFWKWWIPFAQKLQHSYTLAFFAYFIPITILSYGIFFIFKKYNKIKLNKWIKILLLAILLFFIIPGFIFQFDPSKSTAYQNDIGGFQRHNMTPLNAWMYFHMFFWFVWMISPHILGLFTKEKTMLKIAGVTWIIFLIIWLLTWHYGSFFGIRMVFECNF